MAVAPRLLAGAAAPAPADLVAAFSSKNEALKNVIPWGAGGGGKPWYFLLRFRPTVPSEARIWSIA